MYGPFPRRLDLLEAVPKVEVVLLREVPGLADDVGPLGGSHLGPVAGDGRGGLVQPPARDPVHLARVCQVVRSYGLPAILGRNSIHLKMSQKSSRVPFMKRRHVMYQLLCHRIF